MKKESRRAARASRGAAHRDAAPVDPFTLEHIPRKYRVKVGSVVYDARVLVDYWRRTAPRRPWNAHRTEVSPANVERVRRVAASADSSPEVSPVNWSGRGLPSSRRVAAVEVSPVNWSGRGLPSRFGESVAVFPYSMYPDWDRRRAMAESSSLPDVMPRARYAENDATRAAGERLRATTYRDTRQ